MKKILLFLSLSAFSISVSAGDIDPSGFSLFSGGKFYVLTDGVFSSKEDIQVRFESGGRSALESYGGVDVRLYRIAKPLEFLKSQRNLHRPDVQGRFRGEGLSNVLSYVWDSLYKKTRLAWQRVFSPEARKTVVTAVPELKQKPAHTYRTEFSVENQFAILKGFELIDSFRYPIWQAKLNEPPKNTQLAGSSSNFIRTAAGNVILPMGKRAPGLYLVEAMIGSYRATTLVFVSNSVVVTKVSSEQALVWTADRVTGMSRPLSRIVLTDGVGILDVGLASSGGVYEVKRSIPERTFVMVEDQEGGISISENFFYDSEVYQSKIFMFTDRPLYQPGDLVSVRALGRNIERKGSQDVWSPLSGTAASLSVIDSTGVTLFSQKMAWAGAEGGETKFRLPASAESGGYSLRLRFDGEDYGAAFRVARFVKPHFDAQIVFDKAGYKVGEAIKGRVVLNYPSGQPVVGAEVDLQLRSEQMTVFEGSYGYKGAAPVELTQKTYRSNEKGEVIFSVPPATKPARYIATARAMDQGAYRVSTKKELLIEGFLESFILTSELNASEPGVPVKITYDRQGSASADTSQALSRWQAIRLEDRSVESGEVQAVDRGEFTIQLQRPGHYMVRVVDIHGVTRGILPHVILGPDLKSITGQVEILANKESYDIGEKAQLTLTFPAGADDALLTLERNDVASYGRLSVGAKWFKAARTSPTQWKVEVPITELHAPNIVFSVAFARNGEFGFQNKGLVIKKPMIDVLFKADKTSYLPGEKVVINVETRLQGKPFPSMLAVGVVDEMIYTLQPEIAPSMGEFFHHQRRNQVRTTSSLAFYSFNPAISEATPEASSTARRDLKLLQERARRDARDTAYWNGRLKTDSSGRARFEFVMPDALTRWRITGRAIALTAGTDRQSLGAVGESKAFVLSNKDFFLKWTGPTRFRKGDKPRPALIAFNSTSQTVKAEVLLSAKDYSFNQKISMRPGVTSIILDKIPEQSQKVEARLVHADKVVDLLVTQLEFVSESWMQTKSRSVQLDGKAPLALPAGAHSIRLKVLPDASAQFLRVADDLIDYPWGCAEQTASRLIPLTMAVRAIDGVGGVGGASAASDIQSLRDRIAADRRRLVAMAGRNADFSWWGDQTQGDLLITAHAYHADKRAAQLLGIEVPKENGEHLLEIYSKSKDTSVLSRAYALWVLAYLEQPVNEQLQALAKQLAVPRALKTQKSNLSQPGSVVMDSDSTQQSLAALLVTNLLLKRSLAVPQNLLAQVLDIVRSNPAGPLFQSAILVYKLRTRAPGNRVSEAQVLLSNIRTEAPTVDRAMALAFIEEALPQAAKFTKKSFEVGADWKKISNVPVTTYAYTSGNGPKSTLRLPLITGAVGELVYESPDELKATNQSNLFVSRQLYRLSFNDSEDGSDSGSEGLKLSTQLVGPGEVLDSRAVYLDEVTVTATGTAAAKSDPSRFLLLEVPLPSGAEVDPMTWGLEVQNIKTNFTEPRASGSGLAYATPIEALTGEQKFHQLVRFSSRGHFVMPPARVFKMYRPSEQAFDASSGLRAVHVQ